MRNISSFCRINPTLRSSRNLFKMILAWRSALSGAAQIAHAVKGLCATLIAMQDQYASMRKRLFKICQIQSIGSHREWSHQSRIKAIVDLAGRSQPQDLSSQLIKSPLESLFSFPNSKSLTALFLTETTDAQAVS